MSSWARSRSSPISERTSSMCIPADSAYWVTLSCSSRAMRWRSSSSTSRCRAAPSSAWVASELGVAGLEVGGLAGGAGVQAGGVVEQRRVLQRRGRLTGEDAQHGVVGVLDLPLGRRPGGEPADDAPVEPDRARAGGGGPGARRARRRGARRETWSTWWRTCSGGVVGRPAHEVARPHVRQLALDQREHHPLRREVLGGGVHDRPHERLRALHGAHQRAARSAPTPGSPVAAARRRSGTRGSSAACPSAGR